MNHTTLTTLGKAVIQEEAKAIEALLERIDHTFEKACNIMLQCQGRIVVIGMGKSGHIGSKLLPLWQVLGHPHFLSTQVKRVTVIWGW